MQLTQDQLRAYEQNGYLLLPGLFSKAEINILRAELFTEFSENTERRIMENDGSRVRSVYGSHRFNKVFTRLSRHPKLVQSAMTILGNRVYVYQFKINAKVGFGGDVWQWHQDYIFWQKEDGLPSDRITTAVVFLNDITRFNAPLFLIPGSHRDGCVDVDPRERKAGAANAEGPAWISNLTADLKYALDFETIDGLVRRRGIFSAEGPSGTLLFFHSKIVHGSTNNISPFDRNVVLVSYNSVDNIPVAVKNPRPDFLVSRDYEAIVPLGEDALVV